MTTQTTEREIVLQARIAAFKRALRQADDKLQAAYGCAPDGMLPAQVAEARSVMLGAITADEAQQSMQEGGTQ